MHRLCAFVVHQGQAPSAAEASVEQDKGEMVRAATASSFQVQAANPSRAR